MILVVDNYDSFVTRYFRELGATAIVKRNDALSADALDPAIKGIVISPGPCAPRQAGVSLDLIRNFSGRIPILGICLGHQCIGEVFGGLVTRARRPMHGEASVIRHYGAGVLNGVPDGFSAGRYHSLIVELAPGHETPLIVTARSEDGEIMGLEHRIHPTFGVQFHPESVLTEHGHAMLRNFLALCQ
jgi:para-aminobenzoate synthetase component II